MNHDIFFSNLCPPKVRYGAMQFNRLKHTRGKEMQWSTQACCLCADEGRIVCFGLLKMYG